MASHKYEQVGKIFDSYLLYDIDIAIAYVVPASEAAEPVEDAAQESNEEDESGPQCNGLSPREAHSQLIGWQPRGLVISQPWLDLK